MAILYHVAPNARWLNQIKRQGLVPRTGEPEDFFGSEYPRIILFEDEDTAEDVLANFLIEDQPNIRYWVFLEVEVPDDWVMNVHPKIQTGSYYVTDPIPAEGIRFIKKIDVGETEWLEK